MKQSIILAITAFAFLMSCQGQNIKNSLDSTKLSYELLDLYIPTDSTQLYFPVDFDKFRNEWYSIFLFSMREPVLFSNNSQKEIYRFLWLRSFHNPISIRIEKQENIYLLTWKLCNGAGGYEPRQFIIAKQKQIDEITREKFKTLLNQIDFWNMETDIKKIGLDGSQWILEGKNVDKYHVVDRWTPRGDKYSQCCDFLIGITDLTINEKDKY